MVQSEALSSPAGLALAENCRVNIAHRLDPENRAHLGQYMTPAPVARFMASLFTDPAGRDCHLLDAGAGVGSLTAAFVDRLCGLPRQPRCLKSTLYEIDADLQPYLKATLATCRQDCRWAGLDFTARVRARDFIRDGALQVQRDLFAPSPGTAGYTHAILNPPYRKIRQDSTHRRQLREAGIETGNLYTGFLALATLLLVPEGELVAIVPRSWCNGPYYRRFRQMFLAHMSLRQVHVFNSRREAFRDDDVLQENIILYAVRTREATSVRLTASRDSTLDDVTERTCCPDQIVHPTDPNLFVHLAPDLQAQHVLDRIVALPHTLASLGLEVSTGPVVHFRVRDHLRFCLEEDTVPLIWSSHFQNHKVAWKSGLGRKPVALIRNSATVKWLYPRGTYTLVRRFSAKEEHRRIVAAVLDPEDLPEADLGFENHLNVFHAKRQGLPTDLARGLAAYLNSSLVEAWFRQFSGHTQVNATDLRALRYPSRATLMALAAVPTLDQKTLDQLLEGILQDMTDISSPDPIQPKQRITEAIEVLTELGLPQAQQNDRSALTLLALLGLRPDQDWSEASSPMMGVTPIMDFCRDHYGSSYAPNTRETFRRQTLHQFVDAALVVENPDAPTRSTNSPKWCYQIESGALALCRGYGTAAWDPTLTKYLAQKPTLQEQYAKQRQMTRVAVTLPDDRQLDLSAGAHSELIRDIVEQFGSRFVRGGHVLYLGDTGAKWQLCESETFAALGLHFDPHGQMPDVVLYHEPKNWLLLIEAVTSHGPMNDKRRRELADLFSASTAGLVYVTAFPSRKKLGQYLPTISWETEVWIADDPDHLIHFDGERFLGPYPAV